MPNIKIGKTYKKLAQLNEKTVLIAWVEITKIEKKQQKYYRKQVVRVLKAKEFFWKVKN